MSVRILKVFGNRHMLECRMHEMMLGGRTKVARTTGQVTITAESCDTVIDLMVLGPHDGPEKLRGRKYDLILVDDSAYPTQPQREELRFCLHRGAPGA